MIIQKIKIVDKDPLNEKTVNVPLEHGEKILSNQPYVLDVINAYRAAMGGTVLEDISRFETAGKDTLIDNVAVCKQDDKFIVNINSKYDCMIPIEKEPEDVRQSFEEGVAYKVPITACTKNGINVSIKDSMKLVVKNELRVGATTHNTQSAYTAHIDECINGGYYVSIQGVKCFMPGSTASLYKLSDFESIVGSDIMVIPTMYNAKRDMVVVSHVAFLEAIKPTVLNSVMNDDRETEYTGIVTLKKHDYLLITFNECLAGKLVYTDMDDETKELFNNNKIEIEKTEIKFKIDDEQNGQLLLTQTWKTRQLWKENISKEFKVGMTLDGVVLGTSKKYILVQLKYNAIGILPMTNLLKIGDHASVKISNIDIDNRKIKLTLC